MKRQVLHHCILAAITVSAVALAASNALSGASDSSQSSPQEGAFSKRVTFRTAQNAPERFDAFTFFWSYPIADPDARLVYSVSKPDGTEYFKYHKIAGSGSGLVRSDFKPGFPAGDLNAFFGKAIAISFAVTHGDLKFDPDGPEELGYHFAFYTNGPNGKVDWKLPFTTIAAVKETK